MKAKILFTIILIAFSLSASYAQEQGESCPSPIEYGNHNQIEPNRSSVRKVSGRVIHELSNPAKEIELLPACLGLFTEKDHRLVASAVAGDDGNFKFGSVPVGNYRLVVRDAYNVFCVANMPLRLVRWPRGRAKSLVIHMRPAGIDDCSYGAFK